MPHCPLCDICTKCGGIKHDDILARRNDNAYNILTQILKTYDAKCVFTDGELQIKISVKFDDHAHFRKNLQFFVTCFETYFNA